MNPISELSSRGATSYRGKRRRFRRISGDDFFCVAAHLVPVAPFGFTDKLPKLSRCVFKFNAEVSVHPLETFLHEVFLLLQKIAAFGCPPHWKAFSGIIPGKTIFVRNMTNKVIKRIIINIEGVLQRIIDLQANERPLVQRVAKVPGYSQVSKAGEVPHEY